MNRVASMEGRLTAPPEIGGGCSHDSGSSRAYQKDESSGSGTSSPGRNSLDGDMNRQLLNILVTANKLVL
uniref:Dachshund n=1 Tax=Panagrolaimus sp. ES5 TaxID=591445 RepID=A0AC34FMK9_9BILA